VDIWGLIRFHSRGANKGKEDTEMYKKI